MLNPKQIINSTPIQFIIGGLTVAAISHFSNTLSNTSIAAVIAAVPIGLPSTVFVNNEKVSNYLTNLLFMTAILFLVTLECWFIHNKYKINKYKSVGISMVTWIILAILYIVL